MIETSSVPPRKSSATFGNLRKIFETCLETLIKPSDQFWKIVGNLRESGPKSSQSRQKHRY